MEFKITTDSLDAALQVLNESEFSCAQIKDLRRFAKCLLVPQEAGEAWVEIDRKPHYLNFKQGEYILAWLKSFHIQWRLYKNRHLITQSSGSPGQEAQMKAWANEKIREREAAEKKPVPWTCSHCNARHNYPIPKEPASFGPGSKFRMPNEDELRVIDWDDFDLCVINLTTSKVEPFNNRFFYGGSEAGDLRQALEAAGAERIEGMDNQN